MDNGKVLAQVGTRVITEQDVNQMLLSLGQRAQQYNNPQGRQAILEQLINKALVITDARKNLMDHDPEFTKELEKLKEELLANFYIDKALRDTKVSEEEAKKFYEENPDQFAGEESLNASHILLEKEEEAKDILVKIQKGEISFEDAAKKYSKCPSSEQGGDLGDFGHGQMVPEFENACFAMQEGEISEPVKTNFGYHLIRLNHKHAAKHMEYDEVREKLIQSLTAEKQQKAYQSKINQLKILYPVDRAGILG